MSYEIIRSINIKKQTITSACNNIRPLTFSTGGFADQAEITEEQFIKRCLVNFIDGEFRANGSSCWKFDYAINKFRNEYKDEYDDLHKRRWETYDYSTHTQLYTEEEINQATEELKDKLYQLYQEANTYPKCKCVALFSSLEMPLGYVKSLNNKQGTLSYVRGVDYAKTFNSKAEAYAYLSKADYVLAQSKLIEI